MELAKRQLLELLRSGLWGTQPDVELLESPDWATILRLAHQQSIITIIEPAIERLPLASQPPRDAAMRLHQVVSRSRGYYTHHIEVLGRVIELLRRGGVERPVLLKGLGVGMNYPDASLRQCGDIDIYVGDRLFDSCCDYLVAELGIVRDGESESEQHLHFDYFDTSIEIHRYAISPSYQPYHSREFMEWCRTQLEGDALREVEIGGVECYLPPYDFDFIYVHYHTWKHLLTGGVGLRQLCDWCCYIDKFHGRLDRVELDRVAHRFGLQRPISLFATIAVESLGVRAESLPNYVASEREIVDQVLEKIWQGGNFGFYREERAVKRESFIGHKLQTLNSILNDMRFVLRLDVTYAIRFYIKVFRSLVTQSVKQIISKLWS